MIRNTMGGTRTRAEAAGIFLLSAACLFFELHAFRFFTLSQWHHFGALVVSLALFGGAAAGVALALSRRLRRADPGTAAATCAVAMAVSAWAGLHAASWIPFRPVRASVGPEELAAVAGWYLCFGVPMFFASLGVLYFLLRRPGNVGTIYASNLLGGAAGVASALWLESALDGQEAAATAVLGLCAATCFVHLSPWRIGGASVFLLLAAWMRPEIPVSEFKALASLPNTLGARSVHSGRAEGHHVALLKVPTFRRAPGLSLAYRGRVPTGLTVVVDGDRPDVLLEPPVDPDLPAHLPGAVGHELAPEGRALILDAAGNLPVLTANRYGRSSLVHLPPEIAGVWFDVQGLDARRYFPGATVVTVPPRTLLRAQPDGSVAYVEIALRDGAATMTAALGQPTEGYLFTVEAWREMLRCLAPDGLLCVTRWLEFPPRESLRLAATAVEALKEGAPAERCLVAFRSLQTITFLIRPRGFDPASRRRLAEALRRRSYELIYPAGGGGVHAAALDALLRDPEKLYASYPFYIRPATDDRPFPWFFLKPGRLGELRERADIGWRPLLDGGFLLGAAAVQAAFIGLILIALPFLRARDRPPVSSAVAPGIYFFLIGLGFLFVEIPLAQILTRSAPSAAHAFGLVIATMFLGAGTGSYLSGRLRLDRVAVVVAAAALVIGAQCALLPRIGTWTLVPGGWWMVGSLLGALPSVAMGMAMPGGFRWAGPLGSWGPSWGWAVNGCASVVSPLLASILALGVGFRFVLGVAAVLYVTAGGMLYFKSRVVSPESRVEDELSPSS
ncbi:MAG: hypothetical protein HY716_12300 [Planctomycetes bacterium]|nr:hypothetical protein [Planctomycetota bacterium]